MQNKCASRSKLKTSPSIGTLISTTDMIDEPRSSSRQVSSVQLSLGADMHQRRSPAQHSSPVDSPSLATSIQEPQGTPIARARKEWFDIQQELPPQITRRNIQMISIGGVIGTGLFLGVAQSLRDGGPIGMLIGYAITGSIVYAVVTSLAEMVAFIPNVGGPVGLADLYVDRALGFAMGWNAWYNWTIVLPAELSAAAVIVSAYMPQTSVHNLSLGVTSALLVAAVTINFLGKYGECEFWLASIKIFTIIFLIILGIILDNIQLPISSIRPDFSFDPELPGIPSSPSCVADIFNDNANGTGKMKIGFKYLACPGAFVQYRGIPGMKGRALGVWSVLMQAIFSYCGSEIPGIAGAEVVNAGKNIPLAVKKLWIRIFMFYIFGVFIVGLIVPFNHNSLWAKDSHNGSSYVGSSPFIIAIHTVGNKVMDEVLLKFVIGLFVLSAWSAATSDVYISSRFMFFLARRGHAPRFLGTLISWPRTVAFLKSLVVGGPASTAPRGSKRPVTPIFAVLLAMVFAVLAFLQIPAAGSVRNAIAQDTNAERAFYWLSSMTAAAAMLSWVSMMFTYVRWHAGIKYAESCDPDFKMNHPELYPRPILQPYLAWYAIVMCAGIILLHGWAVFTVDAVRRIATMPGQQPPGNDTILGGSVVLVFVTSYLPIPMFFLCIFGYKLIKQTHFIELHEMDFDRGEVPTATDITAEEPRGWWQTLKNLLF